VTQGDFSGQFVSAGRPAVYLLLPAVRADLLTRLDRAGEARKGSSGPGD